MGKIIIKLLSDFLEGLTTLTDNTLMNLAEKPFAIEKSMTGLGITQFDNIFKMFISIGVSLIVIKFLKKGFDMYVLWTDGDADADPLQLVINFIKAMAIALTFSYLYSYFAEIILNITNDVLKAIGLYDNLANPYSGDIIGNILNVRDITLTSIVGYVIFFIMFIILEIKLTGIGFEMLILRIGAPLACVGLMDADKGVFHTYSQKFFQVGITIMVQVTMMKLALSLMIAGHLIWGLTGAYFAMTTPKFIKEFLIFSSGGGIANNLYTGARLLDMGKSLIR